MKFVVVDRCPVPAEIAQQVKLLKADVKKASGRDPKLNSGYRGDLAAGLLKRLGKRTQAALSALWVAASARYGRAGAIARGIYPANLPRQSTHELFSDGVAYRGPVGRPIRAWGCGLDWDDWAIPHLIAAAKKRGWELFQPYHTGAEYHHLNFRRKPRIKAKPKPVKPKPFRPAATISAAGAHLIASFEGFRSKPYPDPATGGAPWTIGYGHTAGVTPSSKPLTEPQALALLRKDLNKVYAPAVARAARLAGLELNQNEFDALVSAVYNLGPGILDGGHTLGAALRNGKRQMIAAAFLVYDKAGNPPHRLEGLTRRRQAEHDLFLKPYRR